ncbi:TRAP transporter large permease [Chromohalobacter sp. HP20-39]|uniref:TRAP transporter large permease n=1 Tax=Chromohalobacter sp. HP20-39 TaxID=3079306 RepID=UPI00294AB146|nr:TRAP transporter large permease [Chromohalobacter sp. HP20-39]MDV6317990.1 TRAP transporter large permease [Chromohalobacter sp. HP20-39]
MMEISTGTQMVVLFFVFVLLRVPVAFSLSLSAMYAMYQMGFGLDMVGDLIVTGIAKYSLLAIPFFILAGNIMGVTGIASKMINFFRVLVGGLPGGMGLVGTVVCLFWGAVSGSGPASVAAIGPLIIRGMVADGYSRPFAAGLVCTGAALSLIIPPSIGLVIYGILAQTSISDLFLASIVPGLMLGCLMLCALPFAKLLPLRDADYPDDQEAINLYERSEADSTLCYSQRLARAFKDSFWGLLTPVVILGGIYGGVFTPTEAATVATVYAMFVGFVVYRSLSIKALFTCVVDSASSSAVVMLVVAFASLFGWVVVVDGLVSNYSDALLNISDSTWAVVLVMMLILLLTGMFMDAITIMFITLPIFLPVINSLGLDPTWFGVALMTALSIGLITPPVGINLFVAANITQLPIGKIALGVLPFLVVSLVGLLVITYVPSISLFLL